MVWVGLVCRAMSGVLGDGGGWGGVACWAMRVAGFVFMLDVSYLYGSVCKTGKWGEGACVNLKGRGIESKSHCL